MTFSKFKHQIIFLIMALFYILVSIVDFLYVLNIVPANIVSIRTTNSPDSNTEKIIIGNVGNTAPAVSVDKAKEEAGDESAIEDEPEPEPAAEPEPVSEPEAEPEAEPEFKYYTFITTNKDTILHVRVEPDINSKVIAKLKPGTAGIVTEYDDNWCRIATDKGNITGYCSMEFLSLTELSKEEYDKAAEDMGISL